MPDLIIGTCRSCRYFRAFRGDPTRQCTKRPPTVFLLFKPMPTLEDPANVGVQKFTSFPSPEEDWGCGEFKSKVEH